MRTKENIEYVAKGVCQRCKARAVISYSGYKRVCSGCDERMFKRICAKQKDNWFKTGRING